ncbi:MAG: transglutaminase family protein [Bauldia sp.]|nr:transglutaminase family protein [Bauldia sp.]
MRLRITHETAYRYATPASSVIQILRMQPRSHEGQFVVDWRVELDRDARLQQSPDAFGNTVHSFALSGPLESLTVVATGEVETEDTAGIVRGQVERFPPTVFLRDTRLTEADERIKAFAAEVQTAGGSRLDTLHQLNGALHERMTFDTRPTDATTPATEAFAAAHGVCQDYAHIFIAVARHLAIPARYISGYLFQPGNEEQEAGHGWAEALVDGLGWVAFDPANGVSPTDGYVRVAAGLDYLGAAPVRGSRHGGTGETLAVRVRVEDASVRYQAPVNPVASQSQSSLQGSRKPV